MSKNLFTCFLLIVIGLQTFNRGLIVSGYYLKAYQQSCENKARPWMKCGGRCQMMKKLKSEEKHDQQIPGSSGLEQVLSSKSFFLTVSPFASVTLIHHSSHQVPEISNISRAYFHPPGAQG